MQQHNCCICLLFIAAYQVTPSDLPACALCIRLAVSQKEKNAHMVRTRPCPADCY